VPDTTGLISAEGGNRGNKKRRRGDHNEGVGGGKNNEEEEEEDDEEEEEEGERRWLKKGRKETTMKKKRKKMGRQLSLAGDSTTNPGAFTEPMCAAFSAWLIRGQRKVRPEGGMEGGRVV